MRSIFYGAALIASFSLSTAYADEHHHGSLEKHEHGTAELNVVFEGPALDISVDTPAMNIVDFEHMPSSDQDKATLAAARKQLEHPLSLLVLPAEALCSTTKVVVESPLFGNEPASELFEDKKGTEHSDIELTYNLKCSKPALVRSISFAPFFKAFPGTHKIQVQLISSGVQKGIELTPETPILTL